MDKAEREALIRKCSDTRPGRDNRSVLYHRVPKLFEDLALARGVCETAVLLSVRRSRSINS